MKKGMVIATALLAVLVAPPFGTASRTADPSLPNPCRLLASAHPQTAFGAKVLPVKHRHADHGYIGVATASCDETVGGINVFLMLSTAERGVVPVDKVLSRTALPGPSSGALFVVYLSRDHRLQTRSYGIIFHRDIPPTKTSVHYAQVMIGTNRSAALRRLASRLYAVL
jgi:hypothetical protein